MQRLLAGEIVVQGAYRHARFQRDRAGGQAGPAIALPNPNIGVENGLYGEPRAGLSGPFQRFSAAFGGCPVAHGYPNPASGRLAYSLYIARSPYGARHDPDKEPANRQARPRSHPHRYPNPDRTATRSGTAENQPPGADHQQHHVRRLRRHSAPTLLG